MSINYVSFEVPSPTVREAASIAEASTIAGQLLEQLRSCSRDIDLRHVHGAKSDDIQNVFFPWLESNFDVRVECTEGFENTATRGNRADAQILLDAAGDRRILLEVERGGTVTNNHDLKDVWKAHLSPLVEHLFLVVPNSIVDGRGNPRSDQAFRRCQDRLSGFFIDERTRIDLLSLHLFGYGPDPLRRRAIAGAGLTSGPPE